MYKGANDFLNSQESFDLWYELLADLRFDVMKCAADVYMQKEKYPPTVADIRREYDTLWDEHLAIVRHIKESYESAAGIYPGIDSQQKMAGKEIFTEIVNRYPKEEKERIAGCAAERICQYVREWEAGTEKTILPLDEYMERLKNEFTG